MYDLIGDIHGHADELVELLQRLGYQKSNGTYRHPEREVIFLGDFIDRGPKIRQVLEIVRPMVEEGIAKAVMGNHELNALAFHTEDPIRVNSFVRERSTKNIRQHSQTILQLNDDELVSYLRWFQTLPMWLELDGLRAVHACWDEQKIDAIANAINEHDGITPSFLQQACQKDSSLYHSVEAVLKGKEAKLPDGFYFVDKDGHKRTEMRTRWYLCPKNQSYSTYGLHSDEVGCTDLLEQSVVDAATPYPSTSKPVFVGHYWLSAEKPTILSENVACLDFSVAKKGLLCAYRWNGEQQLSDDNFVWVTAKS